MKIKKMFSCLLAFIVFSGCISASAYSSWYNEEWDAVIYDNGEYCYADANKFSDGKTYAKDEIFIYRYIQDEQNLVIPSTIDGKKVVGIRSFAFADKSMTNITVPSSVIEIHSSAFANCKNLTNVVFPKDTKITYLGGFNGCTALENFTIPNTVTVLYDVFKNCSAITQITIPNSVKEIGSGAFAGTGIEHIDVPESVTKIDGAFRDSKNLKSVSLPKNLKVIGIHAFNNSGITKIDIPASVTEIKSSAFSGCASLETVTFRKGLKKIRSSAFRNCRALKNFTLPSTLTHIGANAFWNCDSLTQITLPKNLKTIYYGFVAECSNLKEIKIHKENKNFKRYYGAIYNAKKTNLIAYPPGRKQTKMKFYKDLKKIYKLAFYGAKGLEADIVLPAKTVRANSNCFSESGIKSIRFNKNLEVGMYCALDCDNLKEYTVEKGNASFSAKSGVLYNKSKSILYAYPTGKTSKVFICPESVKDARYFRGNVYLESVTFKGNMKEIFFNCFSDCSALKEVILKKGELEAINSEAFMNCTSLERIVFANEEKSVDIRSSCFKNTPDGVKFCVKNAQVAKKMKNDDDIKYYGIQVYYLDYVLYTE